MTARPSSRTPHLLAIDQGTTSSRAIVFSTPDLTVTALAQREFTQHYPQTGWVEHDPEEIWVSTLQMAREAIARAGLEPAGIAALGITNQRETVLLWERESGRPLGPAIVWQDRRTSVQCAALREAGHEPMVAMKTGLLLDPYFSASKIAWLLDHVAGARDAAARGDVLCGTIDTFLIWRLTGGRSHVTDATNASRTMLLNLTTAEWDDELLGLFDIPAAILPRVMDCAGHFGLTEPDLLGAPIPILGVAGDQQAAAIGQACFEPGMMKATYGTGCFALLNTGDTPIASRNRLLTTIACQLHGRRTYALEGSIFIAGAAVQWLRDSLGLLQVSSDAERLAREANNDPVVMVPAFVGLGAPHWDAEARGAIFGLTRDSGPRELARAALESVCFQTADLLAAMQRDLPEGHRTVLRADGGMAVSDWTMQRLADILGVPVDRPTETETTALGAAYLAGLAADLLPEPAGFAASWRRDRRFEPTMPAPERDALMARWQDAVRRTLTDHSADR